MVFNPEGKSDCLMDNSKIIYRYLHGGKGTLTLVSPRTYNAHEYSFLCPKNKRDFPEDTIFVYIHHEGHKMYLGMLSGSEFRLTSRSKYNDDTEAVKGAKYIVKMSNRQDIVDAKQMLLYHSGKCCYCGRQLEAKSALYAGIGKKCLRKYTFEISKVPWDGN